jgi:hypothetical protein
MRALPHLVISYVQAKIYPKKYLAIHLTLLNSFLIFVFCAWASCMTKSNNEQKNIAIYYVSNSYSFL